MSACNRPWLNRERGGEAGGFTGAMLAPGEQETRYEMAIELVHIGFGNILAMSRVIAIASPNSAPTKRTIHEARNKGLLIDMTNGRRSKAVITTDSGHIILAALTPETIAGRLQASQAESYAEQGSSLLRIERSDETGSS